MRDALSLRNQSLYECSDVVRVMFLRANTPCQDVPDMSDGVDVRSACCPLHNGDSLLLEEVDGHTFGVRAIIILHGNGILPYSTTKRPYNRVQNMFKMSWRFLCATIQHNDVCVSVDADARPHHNRATSLLVIFHNSHGA